MKRRLVIELYDHTTIDEVADCVDKLHDVGFHDVKYETESTSMAAALQRKLFDDYNVVVMI